MRILPRREGAPRPSILWDRPAFYALEIGSPGRSGWRDYFTLLHPPYTLWHLSYVVFGAALAPTLRYERLGATLLAFFLAVGLSAHALDELHGRPLKTRVPAAFLWALVILGLVGALFLGIAGAFLVSPWLLAFIAFGLFILPAYNLEWFGGRFHTDLWFALAWGTFPFLTAYWASSERFEPAALAGAAAVFALSLAQRTLSKRVRTIRRKARLVEGSITYADGSTEQLDKRALILADEGALLHLSLSMPAISLALLLLRL